MTRARKVGWLRHKIGAAADATAARVLGIGKKKTAEQKLRAKAARTGNEAKRAEHLVAADRAARTQKKRLIGPGAEARAKRALERAHLARGLK